MMFNRRTAALAVLASLAAPAAFTQPVSAKPAAKPPTQARPSLWRADDFILGAAKARGALIEYASLTCGHCKAFHETLLPLILTEYVAKGRLRYAMRAFPTAPGEIAVLGFNLARLGVTSAEDYYKRIGVLFAEQEEIFRALNNGRGRSKFDEIAKGFGLTEAQFEQALSDQALVDAVIAVADEGEKLYGVNSTPTLVLNGKVLQPPTSGWTAETLRTALDAGLAPPPRPAAKPKPAPAKPPG
jgi:protein-disulfide isomerase